MTLQNLLGISLDAVQPSREYAARLLPTAIGLPVERMIVLDALRKQRNLSDYSGDLVPVSAVRECVASAKNLQVDVRAWLATHRPGLL